MRALMLLLVTLGAACDYPRSQPIGGDDAPVFDADPNAPDADPNAPDADPTAPDAEPPGPDAAPSCTATSSQCDNCIDDNSDGRTDGADPGCTSAVDDVEGSFDTGIPGGGGTDLDCFFDGNTGSGDDDCTLPRCCTDRSCSGDVLCDEPQSAMCVNSCAAMTVPGCDCFGCCTVCDGAGCVTITLDATASPGCTLGTIHDPAMCTVCIPNTGCAMPCDTTSCILCPGQQVSDLPGTCTERLCPGGLTVCTTTADCGASQWCGNGCCLAVAL